MNRTQEFTNTVSEEYPKFKVGHLHGRYISFRHIEPLIKNLEKKLEVTEVGKSTLGISIPMLQFGKGKIKILAWSQMHGNESTTTKAVFDLLNFFNLFPDHSCVKLLESKITFRIIPMLNPDGASAYTRVNANHVDLNRDANDKSQEESKILRGVFDDFQPDFCFNLHDQRTIFSAGNTSSPATISFLTPASDEECAITPSRIKSMKIIVAMNEFLQSTIPGQVGRYDDAYNIDCTGDTFQTLGTPTVLFEAGHYGLDYQREKTREFIVNSLICALTVIATEEVDEYDYTKYFQIPENEKLFFDVILRNAAIKGEIIDVAIQFQEVLEGDNIVFRPSIEIIDESLSFYGHREVDCNKKELLNLEKRAPAENDIVDKLLLKNEVLIINNAN